MNEIKKTFFYLNQTTKRAFLYVMIIAVIADAIELFIALQLYYSRKHEVMKWCLHDNHMVIVLVALLTIGFLFGSGVFSGYISMIAKRKTYFIGVLSYSILLILGCLGANRLITFMVSYYIKLSVHSGVQYFVHIDALIEWMLYAGAMSLGLVVGALYYRFNKIVFIICLGIAIWSTIQSHFLVQFKDYFKEKQNFLLMGGLFIVLFFVLSILLLRTAPTQSYAHDLWIKRRVHNEK
ncbi:MAG: hypothetical protein H9872_02995 [Candidatus Cellulosilyticum pullistercoris]|uniref:Uncharacterized protein n=1 Tax=Candidatus Cellulosilyticum pullistercoris TaxID=2838521 RepID=A0A9E2KBE9_9FIRM|nr:hypothetical protein [Candidatus Cellulosilyticum pullistercoris]